MAEALALAGVPRPLRHGWPAAWLALGVAGLVIHRWAHLWPWLVDYPRGGAIPLRYWISDAMKWLVNEADLGLFTFKEFTRSIAWLLDWPLAAANALLVEGIAIPLGEGEFWQSPPLSWIALIAVFVLMAYRVKGIWLALVVGLCFLYMAAFGHWQSAMITLSSILVAVPLGVAGGLWLGILGYRHRSFELVLTPLLDLMQTVPVFAYLIPVLFLFGFGPVAAMIATIIYALPPMVRITMLALKQVPAEVVEFGRMAGCNRRQMTWKILVPAARSGLMVGVNQVIMLSLNMVIIASMIGAGGLGYDVLRALRRLAIGDGVEAGIAITVMAIALDRFSQAYARRPPPLHRDRPQSWWQAHPYLILGGFLLLSLSFLGLWFPALASYPEALQLTTSSWWTEQVKFININFYDQLTALKILALTAIMKPAKGFLLALPWVVVVAALALAGYRLGGWLLSLLVTFLALFIVINGQWEKAMISVYLVGLSVVAASLIGIPLGIWAARSDLAHKVLQVVVDTLQTLPAFVYLIPAVMLFGVGEFSAMLAVIAYAIVPAVRYTDHGIRQVPPAMIEAAKVSGCTPWQMLWKVQLRLALPEIMLGLNQTIMLGLSMLVITALVGSRDLGQEVYNALTKADTGRGLVAGISVACIAMIADRLINAWALQRKKELGLS